MVVGTKEDTITIINLYIYISIYLIYLIIMSSSDQ